MPVSQALGYGDKKFLRQPSYTLPRYLSAPGCGPTNHEQKDSSHGNILIVLAKLHL